MTFKNYICLLAAVLLSTLLCGFSLHAIGAIISASIGVEKALANLLALPIWAICMFPVFKAAERFYVGKPD